LTVKIQKTSREDSIEQELRDEIATLRAQLDKAQALIEFHDYRRKEFSKMLKLGIWEWDEIDDKPIAYSDEMANVFGVDLSELEAIFKSKGDFEKLVHPKDRKHYRQNLDSKTILKPGKSHVFDYRIITRDGETRQLREFEQGVFDDSGKLVKTFGMVQDVSDTHAAITALKESEQRYLSLFAQMPLGVQEEDYSPFKKVVDKLIFQGVEDLERYFLDNPRILREIVGQTRITDANEALVRMHEAESLEEFLAGEADIDDWWDAQWVEYYAAEVAALASDKKYYEVERVDSRIDGSYFETRAIVTLVRGYEDTWERVITIHEDITERKQAEASMIEARNQAEKASQAKSEFLSSMSHELRTPLNAILGFSQLFAYDRNLSAQHLANATEINRAGRHLMSLIDQILDLSRIEAGESDVSLEPVSLRQVLKDSVHWILPLAENRGVKVNFDEAEFKGLNVQADAIRLKQVFLNLLTNAVKYNHEGGRVDLVLERLADDFLRVGVRDTGAGISEKKLKELFQPFNRLGAEFSTIEGTGIGLVITRQLLDLMDGELSIDSEVGQGSTFWVRLELTQTATQLEELRATDATVTSITGPNGYASRILVAEDNLINQELMAAQLEILGYQADYVENGVQALERWRQNEYGLLLTDIRMPEMNGYELVRELRQLERDHKRRTPVIAITANAMDADLDKCYEVGVDGVIPKPVELEDLRDALEKWAPPKKTVDLATESPMDTDSPRGAQLDLNVLAQSTGDKPDLHRHLLTSYHEALDPEIDNIQQAFAWKNSEQIAEYTHKLKSSSRSLGAMVMANICERVEAAANAADWDELETLMPQLRRDSAEAARFIQDYLDGADVADEAAADQPEFVLQLPDDDEDITQFSIKLLLVDDDYIMHRITTVMLNDLGISRVLNAMSGPAALEMLQQNGDRVDVVICDLNMPEMDGVEFIRHLAKRNFGGSLILASGEDVRILKTVEKLAIEHDLHVIGVLEKPATPAKLSELLDSIDQIRQEGTMMMVDPFNLADLEQAIACNQLDTYFQPKVDIASGRVVGVEALVRWNHPTKGLIKPNAFISMAEENGLIGDLTDVVCNKALDYATQLKSLGYDLNVAINISVDSLTNLEWPDRISSLLEQSGLEATSITFEITESRLMEHLSVALDILSRLSLKRFNLSIDDFGTGYSSMEQLQRIPFAEFKIDRAFVHGAAREASARAILESSVLLAKKLDMKVVAEGVEDQDDWDLMAEVGCDQVQGYFVSRPLPFGNLVKWLDEQKSK
jgi:EAL domain-containing protein (putative c-di-GMP-specific phosphodiesterase class I)/signal transduction histidine kinase/DNA-binding response OmpR family regulator/HPt (histidine-containing phosphotransfer) domain-containing protein